jgi:MFS family permease
MPPTLPLRRNRDFLLLQAGQMLSTAGTSSTSIAYPLLVLAVTHSPAKAGLVSFARIVPQGLFGLLAGAAADRWNRKWQMIGADGVRAFAMAALVATLLVDPGTFWPIPIVAFVEGAGSTVFYAAYAGALRAVVPARQLPAASGAEGARQATVRLAGPPLGGALFGIARFVPFLVDAISYAFSSLSLLAMRTPFQQRREPVDLRLRAQIAEGFRFLWNQPFVRTTSFLYGLTNFTGPALLLALVVIGRRQGLSSGEIGALTAAFGLCLLLGSLASPLFRRAFSVRAILLLEVWAWLGCAIFLIHPSVYLLTAGLLPVGVAIPVTDSVVNSYRVAMTPDRLLGRVESVRGTIALLIAPLGPLTAGFLLDSASERATIAVAVGFSAVLAVWGTLSPSIRNAPSLDELGDLQHS